MGWASTFRAACGILGPAAFTAGWAVSSRRQDAYSVADEHISGLAAPDARSPHLMTAGFVSLGAGTVLFASELDRRLGHGRRRAGLGPLLLAAAGAGTIAVAAFRRDRRSNFPASGQLDAPQSWVNDVHDMAAAGTGLLGLGALGTLSVLFARDPDWRPLAVPAVTAAVAAGGLSGWFASDVTRPGNGLVQRASVSLPLLFMGRVAVRMLRHP